MRSAKVQFNPVEQLAYIVSGRAIYHVGDVGHEVRAGSFLVIPAGVVHYIEPLGNEPVMNLDFFLPAREDYMHLVSIWMMTNRQTGVHPAFQRRGCSGTCVGGN